MKCSLTLEYEPVLDPVENYDYRLSVEAGLMNGKGDVVEWI